MTDIIIIYSGEDDALASPIGDWAQALGLSLQLAPLREPDELDAEAIEAQIEEAKAVLVCWSQRAVASSAVRTRAAIASARGKLATCRLTPCAIPFPFDAVATVDMQNWAGRADAPEFGALIATLGERLRRPGLSELLRARLDGGDETLNEFAKRFPDEPEARRIWSEREAKYREECASMLRDARHHLEQRAASERAKIENALATFGRDFDAWLERERRGEATAKPSLNTLFEIWLERGARRGELQIGNGATPDESLKRSAATAEAKAQALQERLDAESERIRELERRLRDAEWRPRRQSQSQELTLLPVAAPSSAPSPQARRARPRRWRKIFATAAVVVLAAFVGAVEYTHLSGDEPPQMRAAFDWLDATRTHVEAQSRRALADIAVQQAREDVLNALHAADADTGIAALTAPAPERPAPAPAAPLSAAVGANAQERSEVASAVAAPAPTPTLAPSEPPAPQKNAVIDPPRPERAPPPVRANEASPPAPHPLQQIVLLPPRDIAPQAALPKLATYRAYDNRDIAGDQVAKLRNYDLQTCVAACRRKENCRGYSFDKWNKVCSLKSSVGEFRLNPRSSSGVRDDVRVPRAPSGEVTMERYPSKAFPGAGYKSVKAEGPDACEDSCRDEDACIAFTFRLDEGSCHLFKTTGEYFPNQLADSGGKRQE